MRSRGTPTEVLSREEVRTQEGSTRDTKVLDTDVAEFEKFRWPLSPSGDAYYSIMTCFDRNYKQI